ncbi:hypothetical protein H6G93_09240 [Nostoc sp. FACHB-973]|nr:hypothetical protein [Nostoc sp. FACHB-973]
MANNVVVTISAKDEASRVIDQLTSKIDSGLGKSLKGAVLGANLMTGAFKLGLDTIGNLFTGLADKLNQAMSIQQQNITTAGTLMKLTSMNFQDAGVFIDDFAIKMSRAAASLPGATSDYVNLGKGIMDNLVPAYKALDGSFNKEGFTEALESISKSAGFLAATSGVDTNLTSQGISKFLGGASSASLAQLKFFEANPAVLSFIEQEAKKLGKDLKDLTARERVEVLQQALKVPKEVIDASTKSVSGLVEGFKSTLFDPQTGVFGIMKDLSKQKGNQSVFTAIAEGLNGLIGENGLLSTIGTTLKTLGIEFEDPMVTLRGAILQFNSKVRYLTGSLKAFSSGNADVENLANNLQFLFNKVFNINGLGGKLAEVTNTAFDTLKKLNWGSVFGTLGTKLAEVLNEIFRFINGLNFNQLGDTLLNILGGVFIGLGKTLSTLDWGALTLSIGKLLAVVILGGIATASALLVAPVVAGIGTLGAAIAAAIVGLTAVVAANWGSITNSLTGFITFVAGKWIQLSEVVNNLWTGIVSSVTGFFSGIKRKFDELLSKIPGLGGQQQAQSTSGTFVPNAASGLTNGLYNAAMREKAQAPHNASLVVANNSELILNRSQQANLARNIGGTGGITIGNITIHTQAQDAKEIAKNVMTCIQEEYQAYSRNNMAFAG